MPAPQLNSKAWIHNRKPQNWGDDETCYSFLNSEEEDLPDLTSNNTNSLNNDNNLTILTPKNGKPRKRREPIAQAISQQTNINNNNHESNNTNNITNPTTINNLPTKPVTQPPNITINNIPEPRISYNEVLLMSKNFSNWHLAFVELQKVFGLKVHPIPDVLHEFFIREEVHIPSTSTTPSSSRGKSPTSNSNSPRFIENLDVESSNSDKEADNSEIESENELDSTIIEKTNSSLNPQAVHMFDLNLSGELNDKILEHNIKLSREMAEARKKKKANYSPAITRSQNSAKHK